MMSLPLISPGKLGDFNFAQAELHVPAEDASQVDDLKNELRKRLHLFDSLSVERSLIKQFDLSDRDYVPASYGSGVVINKNGLILTNYHVVRDATKIYVRLPGDKGSYVNIHAADPRSDLAVLEVLDRNMLPLPAIQRGDGGRLRKGQLVLSIANPFAAGFRDGSPSASWGIVSNLRRRAPAKPSLNEQDRVKLTLHHFGTLIQTDARLNVGCSGGALINLRGELVGLTTALAAIDGSETAGGFAVPLDTSMRRIIDVLEKGEEVEYGFLGVGFERESRPGESVRLGRIIPNSPASRAGLQMGDTILAVDDMPIRENDDLFLAVGSVLAGGEAHLRVRSARRLSRTVAVTLAKFYQSGPCIVSKPRPFAHGLRVDYTSVLLQRDVHDVISPGVYVRDVRPESPPEVERLRNQIITEVNGQAVNEPDEFYRAVDRADKLRNPWN